MLSNIYLILFLNAWAGGMFYFSLKNTSWGYIINFLFIFLLFIISFPSRFDFDLFVLLSIRLFIPLIAINILLNQCLLKSETDTLTSYSIFGKLN